MIRRKSAFMDCRHRKPPHLCNVCTIQKLKTRVTKLEKALERIRQESDHREDQLQAVEEVLGIEVGFEGDVAEEVRDALGVARIQVSTLIEALDRATGTLAGFVVGRWAAKAQQKGDLLASRWLDGIAECRAYLPYAREWLERKTG